MLRFGELGDTLGDYNWWKLEEILEVVIVEAVHKMRGIIRAEMVVIGWHVIMEI